MGTAVILIVTRRTLRVILEIQKGPCCTTRYTWPDILKDIQEEAVMAREVELQALQHQVSLIVIS